MFTFSPNIAVNVRNLDSAVSFYKDVLGVDVVGPRASTCNDIGSLTAVLKLGSGLTMFLDGCTKEQESGVGQVFFEFKCEDLAAAVQVLEGKGCAIGRETSGEGFTGRMITDPFGMRFHVYSKII